MIEEGAIVRVGTYCPETGEYEHTADCGNIIIIDEYDKVPPCCMEDCPEPGASWELIEKLT